MMDVSLWKPVTDESQDPFPRQIGSLEAIAQLRQILGDDSEHPSYIENLPRRGYRLIAAPTAGNCGVCRGGLRHASRHRKNRSKD